jgi:hypothetical protein
LEPQNSHPTLLGIIWAFLSSFALHICSVAVLFLVVTFMRTAPRVVLVDHAELLFVEDSPANEGEKGKSRDDGDEIEEQEQLTLEQQAPVDEANARSQIQRLKAGLEDDFRKGEEALEKEFQERLEDLFVDDGNSSFELKRAQALAEQIRKAHEPAQVKSKAENPSEKDSSPVDKKPSLSARNRYESNGRWLGKKTPTVLAKVQSRGDSALLSGLVSEDIYVVNGELDSVERVLRFLDIPHRMVSWKEFPKHLTPQSVFIVNCSWSKIDRKGAIKVRDFLNRGGYLFTTGWELRHVVMPSVGELVDAKRLSSISLQTKVGPNLKALRHPLLRDVFSLSTASQGVSWRMTGSQPDLPIALDKRVVPLIVSSELQRKYGSSSIALTFRQGQGSVLHIMGHFQDQKSKQGTYTLQQMLVNFILEKQRERKSQR